MLYSFNMSVIYTCIKIVSIIWFLSLCQELMTINSVLAMFRLNLFALSQVFKLLSSVFIISSKSVRLELWKLIFVSSAYILDVQYRQKRIHNTTHAIE